MSRASRIRNFLPEEEKTPLPVCGSGPSAVSTDMGKSRPAKRFPLQSGLSFDAGFQQINVSAVRQASMESWNRMGTFRPYTRMERMAMPGRLFRMRTRKA